MCRMGTERSDAKNTFRRDAALEVEGHPNTLREEGEVEEEE